MISFKLEKKTFEENLSMEKFFDKKLVLTFRKYGFINTAIPLQKLFVQGQSSLYRRPVAIL